MPARHINRMRSNEDSKRLWGQPPYHRTGLCNSSTRAWTGPSRMSRLPVPMVGMHARQVTKAIRQELTDGGRVFIICPLREESQAEGMAAIKVQDRTPLGLLAIALLLHAGGQ